VQISNIPTTPNVVDVVVACTGVNFSTYVLLSDGTVKVAGYNAHGQLGIDSTSNQTSFINAQITGGAPLANITAISANGGYSAAFSGSALALDSNGVMWSTGRNAKGELGLNDTVNRDQFTQITAVTGIIKAELGGGYNASAYCIKNNGQLFTWGYGQKDNLFLNNTTSAVTTPTLAQYIPGPVSKIFFPKGNNLGTNAQMIILTTGNILAYAGENNGQIAINNNTANPTAYKFVPTPEQILNGSEQIVDLFVHGTGTAQRWFILTDQGNLFASGSNLDSVCTGGVSSDTMTANVAWHKISFMP
jgi:alpha-tubulin suppressor-like RCC1 family protein